MKVRKNIPLRVLSEAMPIVTNSILFNALLQYLAESYYFEHKAGQQLTLIQSYEQIKGELADLINQMPAETSNDAFKAMGVLYEIRGLQEASRCLQRWHWISRMNILSHLSLKENVLVSVELMLEIIRQYYVVFTGESKGGFKHVFRAYVDSFIPQK